MENVSFRMWSFLSDEWIFTEIGMSLPVNCKLDTGTAVKESRRLLNCWLRLVLKRSSDTIISSFSHRRF
jgi:hypothetical protein